MEEKGEVSVQLSILARMTRLVEFPRTGCLGKLGIGLLECGPCPTNAQFFLFNQVRRSS